MLCKNEQEEIIWYNNVCATETNEPGESDYRVPFGAMHLAAQQAEQNVTTTQNGQVSPNKMRQRAELCFPSFTDALCGLI